MSRQANVADEGQVGEAGRKVKLTREREIDDVKFILSHPQGRRFVWRYLSDCGVFRSSFTGNSETFFREGERNIGLKLLADVNEADPGAYLKMVAENKEDK